MKSTPIGYKSIRKVLLSIFLLISFQLLKAQTYYPSPLDRMYIGGGMGLSYMVGDTFFDEGIARPSFGLGYGFRLGDQWLLDMGLGYTIYGGRSSLGNVHQSLRYIEMPMILRRNTQLGINYGLGFVLQYHTGAISRVTGVQNIIHPNIYDRLPDRYNLSTRLDADIVLTPMFNLYLGGSFSIPPAASVLSEPIRNASVQFGLRLKIGELGGRVQDRMDKMSESEEFFTSVHSGAVVVTLKTRDRQALYYEQRGDTLKAHEIRTNAREKNLELVEAFRQYYQFSAVYFMYYDSLSRLRKDEKARVFLDDQLNADTSIELIQKPFVFLYAGNVYINDQAITRKGYYYFDLNGATLDYPFPRVESMVNNDSVDVKKLVERINRQTRGNYERLLEKNR